MIRFDPALHAYYLGERRLPNVSSILDPLTEYAGVPRSTMEAARQRGEYVHKMCELWLWGSLDEDAVEPDYLPYLAAFQRFMKESRFVAEHIEERVHHKTLLYAGTLDLAGIFPGIGKKKDRFALVDLKTTFKLLQSVGPQTAAYFEAWNSMHEQLLQERYGLQLKPDGTYKLLPYTSPQDFNVFRSCLAIFNFMRKPA